MRRLFILLLAVILVGNPVCALTPEQWKSDLSVLRQAIAAHPDPFYKNTKNQFERKAAALAEGLGQMNDIQVVAGMADLVAVLGDGHTRLTIPVRENAQLFVGHGKIDPPKIQPFGSFPIRLTKTADGLVVTRTTKEHQDLLGALVMAIQDKPVAEVESAIRSLVYGDNEHQRDYLLPQFLVIPELLAAVNITRDRTAVPWSFRLADSKQVSRPLSEIGAELVSWVSLSKSARPPERRHWFTKSADGFISARLTDILNDPKESVAQFAESLFADVDATPDATLMLDLRDNQGGDNTLNDSIVRAAIRSRRVWEPGRFFVLINGGTFSAASNLATLLERWTPVIFVGQPTGGSPNGYGDPKRTILPNSGLSLRVSTLYWQISGPADKRDCITPLLPVELTVASLRNDRDPDADLIALLAKETASPTGNFVGQWAVPNQQLPIRFQVTAETITLTIHQLKMEAQPIMNLKRRNAILEGNLALGPQNIAVHGRFAGSYLLGWLELSGRPYSFVAKLMN